VAVDRVGRRAAEDDVVAVVTRDRVRIARARVRRRDDLPDAAFQRDRALVAEDQIVAGTATDRIAGHAARRAGEARAADDAVVAGDRVGVARARVCRRDELPDAALECDRALVAEDQVVAGAATDRIPGHPDRRAGEAGAADDRIAAVVTRDRVRTADTARTRS